MKQINLKTDDYEIIEIKGSIALAQIKLGGKLRFVNKFDIPVDRRREHYMLRNLEDGIRNPQATY